MEIIKNTNTNNNNNNNNRLPRMRTIPKAYEEIKKLDKDTCFTLRALRRMVNNGELPVVKVASKNLINLDLLIDKLFCRGYNQDDIRTSSI